MQVVPKPWSTTGLPLRSSWLDLVDHSLGGAGGVGGSGGVGGGGATPHHLALWPALQVPRQWLSLSQPGFVLHLPQLHLASHSYPQAWQVPLFGGGAGGPGAGCGPGPPPHHFAFFPLLHGPRHKPASSHFVVVQIPQLQFSSQLCPQPWHVPLCGPGGAGGGAGGGGDGPVPPHHFALWPELHAPMHSCSDAQPCVLQTPQLQLASQAWPQPWHGALLLFSSC